MTSPRRSKVHAALILSLFFVPAVVPVQASQAQSIRSAVGYTTKHHVQSHRTKRCSVRVSKKAMRSSTPHRGGPLTCGATSGARKIRLLPHNVGNLFGVGSFVTQRSSTISRLVLARAQILGASWVREEFTATRLHDGAHAPYNWKTYDRVVNQERKDRLHVLGLLDYSNTWGFQNHGVMPHADIGRLSRDFSAYAYAVARHFRGRIHDWQIWNEPNLPAFWRPRPNAADYARLLRRAYRAVKRADARNTVVMAGISGMDLPFVRRVSSDGARFDVLSVHPYREFPEHQLIQEVSRLRGLHHPVWFSEIGWPAGAGCLTICTDEAAQAAYLVRFYALAAAAGVGRVFWYDLRDDPHTPGSPEAHFGLLRRDLSAKPAFVAYAYLSRLLRGARFIRVDALNRRGLYALRFRHQGLPIEIVWNTSDVPVTYPLTWPGVSATVVSTGGEPLQGPNPTLHRVTVSVPAGGQPLYVVSHVIPFRLPALGPLLHFAPPPTPIPLLPPAARPTRTPRPGGAWAVPPPATPRPTVQSKAHEQRVRGHGSGKPKATPAPTRRALPTATATATLSP